MKPDQFPTDRLGAMTLVIGLIASLLTVIGYLICLKRPNNRGLLLFSRLSYTATAGGVLAMFAYLTYHMFMRHYQFKYVFEHTANDLTGWYRFASTWSGQEGSFALWAAWTAVIGFLVLAKAGKYEARVMPFYVAILAFLCAILLKQTPFHLIPAPTAAELTANPDWRFPPLDGMGLNPSLQNYWMTIHPPTIFFGFASLAVPFVYAVAAMLWRDYEKWTARVMPYALLSCATLGGGLFMGGYWAYETQGWHGFWAWDPVENASFFPWLAITALMHGLVVQKNRGGMARANTFFAIIAFNLFLVGTFLTRSGALAQEDANGVLLSVHAFANIESSALLFLKWMLLFFGVGSMVLWAVRFSSMPRRPVEKGASLLSRDFAMFMSVLLMGVACLVITLGTTQPLFQSWMKKPPSALKPGFYNTFMMPTTIVMSLFMGIAPWVAWRRTNSETFLKKLLLPWLLMLAFGFFMVFWVQNAERGLQASFDLNNVANVETAAAWISPRVQRLTVVSLTALGLFACLSNAMLAYRVIRAKPLSAGGWLSHVGIGLLVIGAVVSNTYERTERITLNQGEEPKEVFGYKLAFERMTGTLMKGFPLNPDYDLANAVRLRVTPPEGEGSTGPDGSRTLTMAPRWFVHNKHRAPSEDKLERMRWPHIQKYWGHDLYLALASDPGLRLPVVKLLPTKSQKIGPYDFFYFEQTGTPGKMMTAHIMVRNAEGKIAEAFPTLIMEQSMSADGKPEMSMRRVNTEIEDFKMEDGTPGAVVLTKIDPATKEATLLVNLPGLTASWEVPLEVTFKPWVNLVWIGVIIAVTGILLALIRRIIEARKNTDTLEGKVPAVAFEAWEAPEEPSVGPVIPAGAAPIVTETRGKRGGLKRV